MADQLKFRKQTGLGLFAVLFENVFLRKFVPEGVEQAKAASVINNITNDERFESGLGDQSSNVSAIRARGFSTVLPAQTEGWVSGFP